MSGRTIFVSHEWLANNHADPNGEQFCALKQILEDMCNGGIAQIDSAWLQQVLFKQNTILTRKELMRAVPHMFVWFDYISIPQMGARGS